MDHTTKSYLSIREVAEQVNLSYGTVRNLIAQGRLRAIRIGTGRGTYRVTQADLDAFLLGCEVPGPAPKPPTRRSRGTATFTNLDPARLLDAWRRQGVLANRRGAPGAPSSGSSCAPSAPPPPSSNR